MPNPEPPSSSPLLPAPRLFHPQPQCHLPSFSWPHWVAQEILVIWSVIKLVPPTVKAQNLNQWITKEVPKQPLCTPPSQQEEKLTSRESETGQTVCSQVSKEIRQWIWEILKDFHGPMRHHRLGRPCLQQDSRTPSPVPSKGQRCEKGRQGMRARPPLLGCCKEKCWL